MKKVGSVVLVSLLLILILATPASARWRHHGHHGFRHGGFFLGLGVGALLTAPLWYRPSYVYPAYAPVYTYPAYPYAYPAYTYPAYTYPAYTYPVQTYPAYTPTYGAPSSTTPTPQPLSPPQSAGTEVAPAPQGSARNCQTVLVEGHYESRVLANGQRVTAWIPQYTQQVCE